MAQLITGVFYDRPTAESAVDRLEALGYKREDVSVLMDDQTRTKEFADITGTAASGHAASTGAKIGASIVGALAAIVSGVAAKRSVVDQDDQLTTIATSGAVPLADTSSSSSTPRAGSGRGADDVLADDETTGDRTDAPGTAVSRSTPYTTQAEPPRAPVVAGPLAATLAGAGLGGLIGALAGAGVDKKLAERYEQDLGSGGIVIGVAARPDTETRVREILRNDLPRSASTTTRAT